MTKRTFKPYYGYLEILKQGKEISEEEFRFTIEDLYKKIEQKLRIIAKQSIKEGNSINELLEICFEKGEISQKEKDILKEYSRLIKEALIPTEFLLEAANIHQRLIHVVKWIGYE